MQPRKSAKLDRFPTSAEMRSLRERWDAEDVDDIPLKDFDTTLTSGFDDTVSHLRTLNAGHASRHEAQQLQLTAFDDLRKEIMQLREALAGVVQTLNRKAGKSALREFEKSHTAKNDKRIDNLFKLVTFLGVAIGILIAVIAKVH